ncbi:cardiolipin synthase [Neotabrizicola sp. sgz301269]|uniref:cardiolipin synthase n=1 Tax=Neotabrizicola sp. sgz301269 TaxID=3276282 RepID=UPI00377005C8
MLALFLHIAVTLLVTAHILLRRHRQPETRAAWLLIVLVLPYVGALAYLLVGQSNIGKARARIMRKVISGLPSPPNRPADPRLLAQDARALVRVGQSISGYPAVGGNRALLMAGSDAVIAAMVADIDAAREQVHLSFYIWLDDGNGRAMANALIRAARRGVTCRALVDDLGSRHLTRSALWKDMAAAGVKLRRALPVGNPILRMLSGRIDLRNHRKLLVVDTAVAYCGSQNCADPAFLPKARFAPWVDVMMRFEGPVVWQSQHLFASDWMGNGGDDISGLLHQPVPEQDGGFVAQVVATGPTYRAAAMPELFASLIYAAQHDLFITTPYYVPTQMIQAAICAAATRGVAVTLILPARNDDFAVGAASRSHYESLLEAGVRLCEFQPGLLHAKTLTLDGDLALIGSANMDRRSFELNYENNILISDRSVTAELRARQEEWLRQSRPVTLEEVGNWGIGRRLTYNTLAILGPLL